MAGIFFSWNISVFVAEGKPNERQRRLNQSGWAGEKNDMIKDRMNPKKSMCPAESWSSSFHR
jgi:hypothetical protein